MKNVNDVASEIIKQTSNKGFVNGMTKGGATHTLGNGTGIYVGGGQSLEDLKDQKIKEQFNIEYEKQQEIIDARVRAAEEKSNNAEKYLEMEIIPINSYVLVKPFKENPFEKIEMTKSGIMLLPNSGEFKNPDTGKVDQMEKIETVAEVIECSPINRYVEIGDVVMYKKSSGVPVPFFNQGYQVVAETSIMAVINDKLTERYKKIKEHNEFK